MSDKVKAMFYHALAQDQEKRREWARAMLSYAAAAKLVESESARDILLKHARRMWEAQDRHAVEA